MSGRFPRLLRLAVAELWRDSGFWSPDALRGQIGNSVLSVKRSHTSQHFMYTAAGRDAELLPDDPSLAVTPMQMRAAEFFSAISDKPPPFLYFTEPLQTLSPLLLERATRWESLDATGTGATRPPWVQLWAGSAGVTTQAHYDVAENVFVQLHGEKEFLLWPPSCALSLHVFPDAHPRARKAQLRVEEPDTRAHPRGAELPAPLRAVLRPGDAIFIPAFWFHHVTSLSPSVSLNVFSESSVAAAATLALSAPSPLHAAWPLEARRAGLAALYRQLVAALRSPPPDSFVADLVSSRFAPLGGGGGSVEAVPSRRRRRAPPPPSDVESWPELSAFATECAECINDIDEAVGAAARADELRWAGGASAASLPWPAGGTFGMDYESSYLPGVREIVLAHLVELWSLRLFGPAQLEGELDALAARSGAASPRDGPSE